MRVDAVGMERPLVLYGTVTRFQTSCLRTYKVMEASAIPQPGQSESRAVCRRRDLLSMGTDSCNRSEITVVPRSRKTLQGQRRGTIRSKVNCTRCHHGGTDNPTLHIMAFRVG